ncbi:MAG: hypothetical protein WD750_01570 [Gammaproteobacteria bacterium]
MFDQSFLKQQNAVIDDDGNIGFPGVDIGADACPETFITIVPGFCLLHVAGSDAVSFLHAQLTCDVENMADGAGSSAAWCNPKGRVIATFLLFRLDNEFFLLLPSVLKESVVKRLNMFVLRADVRITDFTEGRSLLGVRDQSENSNAFSITKLNERLHLFLPDTGSERCLIIDENERLQKVWTELTETFRPVDSRCWALLDIKAGIPWLNHDTTEQFLPQELSLEESGGLSFSKGCYPGQEVVARVHYRGQVKRRLFHASADGNTGITPGLKIRDEAGKSTGTVVSATAMTNAGAVLLIVIETASAQAETLFLENGTSLKIGSCVTLTDSGIPPE